MSKRITYCRHCPMLLAEDDYFCIDCGNVAIVQDNQHYAGGEIEPVFVPSLDRYGAFALAGFINK